MGNAFMTLIPNRSPFSDFDLRDDSLGSFPDIINSDSCTRIDTQGPVLSNEILALFEVGFHLQA